MAFQNNRGGYAGDRNSGRNSGGFNGNSGGGNKGPSNYLRSSTFVKSLIYDNEAQEGQKPPREPSPLTPGVTEEIAVTLTAAKVDELFKRLTNAVNDPQGDGGIRITLYCQHKTNKDTGEEFDGASMMIVGKFPPKNQQQGGRGSFGGGQGRGGNNGRRDYGNQGGQGNGQPDRGSHTSSQRTNGNGGGQEVEQGKSNTHGAPSGSQRTTSPSDNQQSYDEPGW